MNLLDDYRKKSSIRYHPNHENCRIRNAPLLRMKKYGTDEGCSSRDPQRANYVQIMQDLNEEANACMEAGAA